MNPTPMVSLAMPAKFRRSAADDYCWLPYENPAKERTVAHDAAAPMAEWDTLDSDGRKNLPAKYRIEVSSVDGKAIIHVHPVVAAS